MIADILTVMWKEAKGLFRYQGSLRTVLLNLLVPAGMLGIFLPWQEGRDWVSSPLALIGAALIPALLVGMKIPDSFAGERERHTLGTLLASRLPDRAILFGKVFAAIAYGWGMAMVVLLIGLVTVNVAHWEGQLLLYSPTIALAGAVLSLLVAVLMAGAGVLISLRSATVQAATQTLLFAVLVVPMILQVAFMFALGAGPEGNALIRQILGTLGSPQVVLTFFAALALVDVALLLAATARFQRARLILD
ncbi:MAG: ABC transporter permease [Anaerolineae bacterium]|nr:ABC transporter permease [Anaerolineae bacterium]NIN97230.1 ABC transporter permease [Anaerolineae bacterium]NIQ80182.1 ABC transporter permease [Anaerolineae bacterium]